jgi:nucleotide-binding universal stress UspA family protein
MTTSTDWAGTAAAEAPAAGGGRPRVVVGVDGSPGSRAALVQALIAAVQRGADLEVVSTYRVDLYDVGGARFAVPDIAAARDDQEARARAMVAEVVDELAATYAPGIRDIEITFFVSSGPPAQALLDRSAGAALLVVGSRGRGAVRSALLGSVALHCAMQAACPVLVVHRARADLTAPPRVLVGVDGSDGSRAALTMAVDEAVRTGGEVEALASYATADYWTDLASITIPSEEQIRSDLELRTRRLVEDVVSSLGEARRPPVRVTVAEGPASDVLVRHAQEADLLVVGSHGRGAFRGLLLGSIALHCAMHAPGAVMVVHAPRHRTSPEAARPEPAMADH